MKTYDLIFGIGAACSCTQALRKSKLQISSYPLDWLFGSDFSGRVDFLVSEFKAFIEQNDLEFHFSNRSISCDAYLNKRNGIVFNHDFPKDVPLEASYSFVRAKYERRITRLLNNIQQADSVLVVYMETPDAEQYTPNEEILCGWQKISNKYPDKQVDLLYLVCDLNLQSGGEIKEEELSPHVKKVVANYKDYLPGLPPYAVNPRVMRTVLKPYRLRTSFSYKLKYLLKNVCIHLIPIKSMKKELKRKFHV